MNAHLKTEIELLKNMLSHLSAEVESAVQNAVKSLADANRELASGIIVNDMDIDTAEVRIEEECLKVMALYQPVAGDLRYVITLIKVNAELERIGDLAVNIAERVLDLPEQSLKDHAVPDFAVMAAEVRQMLKNALDSLISRDALLALQVINNDDKVDAIHRKNYHIAIQMAKKSPENVEIGLTLLAISRNLERIADCTTNICEDVIYLEQGKIVRHSQK